MNRLKIAVVVGQFPTVSETFIINQVGFLKQQGHYIDILCLGKKNNDLNDNATLKQHNLMDDAFMFTWRNLMPLNPMKRLVLMCSILFKAIGTQAWVKLIKAINPFQYKTNAINGNQFFRTYFQYFFTLNSYDVVHVHFGDNAVQLEKQLKHHTQKTIVTFHGYDTHNFDAAFYKNIQTLKSIEYTTNTQFLKHKITKLGFQESKIKVLPVGLNTSYFSPEKKPHNIFNVLFIGRLIELKAPLLAIKIIERLIENGYQNIHLFIIGEGEEYLSCMNYISANELDKYVTLLGTTSQADIKDYMNISDAFLFPGIIDKNGRCEAQGLVLQEAQSMELPVIISDVGGMHEGMQNNKTGFVVKSLDINAFSECIITLINHSEKQKKIGKAGRKFVKQVYDNSVLGTQLLKIYQS